MENSRCKIISHQNWKILFHFLLVLTIVNGNVWCHSNSWTLVGDTFCLYGSFWDYLLNLSKLKLNDNVSCLCFQSLYSCRNFVQAQFFTCRKIFLFLDNFLLFFLSPVPETLNLMNGPPIFLFFLFYLPFIFNKFLVSRKWFASFCCSTMKT